MERLTGNRRSFLSRIGHDLANDRGGVIIILFALMLPILVGFIGLAVEVALWYQHRRNIQSAADAAAIAAAYEIAEGASSTVRDATARREAQRNDSALADADITINKPPAISTVYNDTSTYPNAVEVSVTKQVTALFAGYFMDSDLSISTHAVGDLNFSADPACVLSLSSSGSGTVNVAGGAAVTMTGCTVASNSDGTGTGNGITINTVGGASLAADCVNSVGGTIDNGVTTSVCSSSKTGTPVIADPYEDIDDPPDEITACDGDHTNFVHNSGGTETIDEETFCNGIDVSGGSTLVMNSGLYIIDEGDFKISGNSNVTATNVTIVFTDSSGNNCGDLQLTGASTIDMTAQTSGTYSGILFFRSSRCSDAGADHTFAGGTTAEITGAFYFPNKGLNFSGGTTVTGSCVQIVADTVNFTGSGTLGSDCDGTGVNDIFITAAGALVE